jgi:hypothetical protein
MPSVLSLRLKRFPQEETPMQEVIQEAHQRVASSDASMQTVRLTLRAPHSAA